MQCNYRCRTMCGTFVWRLTYDYTARGVQGMSEGEARRNPEVSEVSPYGVFVNVMGMIYAPALSVLRNALSLKVPTSEILRLSVKVI